MNKAKAYLITTAFMGIVGCVIWMMHKWQIWSYYALIQIFGWYGFVAFGVRLGKWLAKPEPEKKTPSTYEEWATEYEQ